MQKHGIKLIQAQEIMIKMFSSAINFFYKREKSYSNVQLEKDFGEFPPAPLNCENRNYDFTIVRVRGLGISYNRASQLIRAIFATDAEIDASTDLEDVREMNMEFLDARHSMLTAIHDFRNAWKSLRSAEKIASAVILAFLLILALPLVVCVGLYKLHKIGRVDKNIAGYFMPLLKNESQITAMTNRAKSRASAVISHEHIHFLQHKLSIGISKKINLPKGFFSRKSYIPQTRLLYLLEKHEMEARLHEIIISYYRAHKKLPLSKEDFWGLLTRNTQIGDLINMALTDGETELNNNQEVYRERDPSFAADIRDVLLHIEDIDHFLKYVTEVMPVMYANLLGYYGDITASSVFMKEISRPNFYDELYG